MCIWMMTLVSMNSGAQHLQCRVIGIKIKCRDIQRRDAWRLGRAFFDHNLSHDPPQIAHRHVPDLLLYLCCPRCIS
jgi:hypothetical protein